MGCCFLFQQTTLLDDLTVAGNLCVALQAYQHCAFTSYVERDLKIKQLLDSVGLDYARDANKRPTELSGGMARRASLALQLAQKKHVIVLDEPFTGLDYDAAMSVAKELVHIRKTQGTALLLISHEPDIAAAVMDPTMKYNITVTLEPPTSKLKETTIYCKKPSLFGTQFRDRFWERLMDYLIYSLPLILLAFLACGLAIAMLSADLLQRLDVTDKVLDVVDKEVKPLIKLVTGEDANILTMMGIKMKIRGMLNSTVPEAKATMYALGMAKLFVLEIGPLLTALLLAGRIGGSYSGKIATMQATAQNKLLRTLGLDPVAWSLWPAMFASLIAAPLLTASGTVLALFLGSVVGPRYGIGEQLFFWTQVRKTVFPELRLRCVAFLWQAPTIATMMTAITSPDYRTTYSDSYMDAVTEIVTYPLIFHVLKAKVFMLIIILVAQICSSLNPNLTPRGVPVVITSSVVVGGLLVILADWCFSQIWLLRK